MSAGIVHRPHLHEASGAMRDPAMNRGDTTRVASDVSGTWNAR